MAVLRRGCRTRHTPERLKGSEMVEPHQIKQGELAHQALQPPTEARSPMASPAVNRGAPELARGRKVIRRDTALLGELACLCQGKQAAATPDVGAVMGHVKGQITHHLHPLAVGLAPQVLPLPLEMPLEQGLLQQGYGLLLLELAQGRALMLSQGSGPVPPGLVGVDPADHHETAVILQPMALLAAPAIEGLVRTGGLIGPALG